MSRLPETNQGLLRKLRQRDRQMVREQNASAYSRSGMSVTAEDEVTVDGAFIVDGPLSVTQTADITGTTHIGGATDIDGTLNVDAATTIGGTLGVTGATTLGGATTVSGTLGVTGVTTLGAATSVTGALNVTGPMTVSGTLSLPAGIIDNDALNSPIEIDSGYGNADSFTVTTTDTDFITFTIPIPAGYTRALVKAEGMVYVYNSSAVGDYLSSRLYVDSPVSSSGSRELLGDLNPTSGVSLTITKQTVITGLAGGVITIRQRARTAFASMYYASNGMTATASVWFLR